MKTKLILIGLLVAGLFILAHPRTQAQGGPQKHIVVLVGDIDTYHRGENSEYIQTGRQVQWIDATGALPVEIGTSLSRTIWYYMDLGCTHEMISARVHLFRK